MLRFPDLFASTMALLVLVGTVRGEDKLWLVRDGRPDVAIVGGGEDDYAAKRLRRWFSETAGVDVRIVAADVARLPDVGCLILLGSAASNPLIGKMAAELKIEIDPSQLTEQGYVARRVSHGGRQWLILAGGGREGVVYAVTDLINWELDATSKGVCLGALDVRRVPRFKYRWFWTWDNRMGWGGAGRIARKMASVEGGAVFDKAPQAFLTDYKRCIDYMADHKFNGLIVWGFLRDKHGGVEASRELCRYAGGRGVRILPGVGTSGYGGYYFEGRHRYNVDTWLSKHPELRAVKKDGTAYPALCPSNPANKKWLDDGAQWLFNNFEIGGANLEIGDFLVCHCDGCNNARGKIRSSEPDYYKDMAISQTAALKKMRSLSPGAWLSYVTYTGYTREMAQTPPAFLSMIPEDSLCQWTLTRMVGCWPCGVRPPARHNIGNLHWCNVSSRTEDDYYLNRVHDVCREASASGLEGIEIYGELGDDKLNAEIFYLAWEAFLWNPDMTVEEFVEQRLGRLFGGAKAARTLLEIVPLVRTKELRDDPKNVAKARELAMSARAAASPQGRERWDKLLEFLGGVGMRR